MPYGKINSSIGKGDKMKFHAYEGDIFLIQEFLDGRSSKKQLLMAWSVGSVFCTFTDQSMEDNFFVLDVDSLRIEDGILLGEVLNSIEDFSKGETVELVSIVDLEEETYFSHECETIVLTAHTHCEYGVVSIEFDFIKSGGSHHSLEKWNNPFKFFSTLIKEIKAVMPLFKDTGIQRVKSLGTSDGRSRVYSRLAKKQKLEVSGKYILIK